MTRVGFKSFDVSFLLDPVTHVESHVIRLDGLVCLIVIGAFDDTSNPTNQTCN